MKRFPSLFAVRSGVRVEAGVGKNSGHEVADEFVVVCDEDSLRADWFGGLQGMLDAGAFTQRGGYESLMAHDVACVDLSASALVQRHGAVRDAPGSKGVGESYAPLLPLGCDIFPAACFSVFTGAIWTVCRIGVLPPAV